jgi:hypothetical protein
MGKDDFGQIFLTDFWIIAGMRWEGEFIIFPTTFRLCGKG